MVNGTKVLIAEDEYIVALDLKNILTKAGYSITSACSKGEDVIHQAKLKKPDLLIIDNELKGTISVVEVCKAIYSISPIPIVFLTSLLGMDTDELLKTYKCEVVLKPFQEDLLLKIIQNVLIKS